MVQIGAGVDEEDWIRTRWPAKLSQVRVGSGGHRQHCAERWISMGPYSHDHEPCCRAISSLTLRNCLNRILRSRFASFARRPPAELSRREFSWLSVSRNRCSKAGSHWELNEFAEPTPQPVLVFRDIIPFRTRVTRSARLHTLRELVHGASLNLIAPSIPSN
jgi:hypothetical protein